MKQTTIAVGLAALVLTSGCEKKDPGTPQTNPDNPSTYLGKSAKMARDTRELVNTEQAGTLAAAEAITGEGQRVEVSGVVFQVPSTWTKVDSGGRSSMAPAAEFRIDGADGAARLVFFNAGGSVDMNLNRWKGQMKDDQGGAAKADVQTKNIGGAQVTTIRMEGTYSGMTASGTAAPQPDTLFLGAIFEGRQGQVQVRLTGPFNTVKPLVPAWTAMIEGSGAR